MLHRWETSSQTTVERRAVIQDLEPNTSYQFRVRASTANEVRVGTMRAIITATEVLLPCNFVVFALCQGEWLAEMV